MITPALLDINIAIIGNVSAGKSTLLNALLCAKYSEVSMKRTTAGINYFRIHRNAAASTPQTDSTTATNAPNHVEGQINQWTALMEDPHSAAATLEQITADNAVLRKTDRIQEKYFNVEIAHTIVEDMHPRTRLVLVDIPGINEAAMGNKYKDYLKTKWHTFDCVIVVMDSRHGVNTEDQIELLKLVKDNQMIRWQPVIVVCNKVDDPDDEEQAEMVADTRKEVERMFDIGNCQDAMKTLLSSKRHTEDTKKPLLPAFLPMSARHAYFHQTASLLTYEQFCQFDDKDIVEKYGREVVGRREWKKMTENQKFAAIHEIMTDPHQSQESLEISNFDQFSRVLSSCIGESNSQIDLVRDRLNASVPLVSVGQLSIAHQLDVVYREYKVLVEVAHVKASAVEEDLAKRFWVLFDECIDQDRASFQADPLAVRKMGASMDELEQYFSFTTKNFQCKGQDEEALVAKTMKTGIQHFINILIDKEHEYEFERGNGNSTTTANKWSVLSPLDWCTIWGSILMLTHPQMYLSLGKEKLEMERLVYKSHQIAYEDEVKWGNNFEFAPPSPAEPIGSFL